MEFWIFMLIMDLCNLTEYLTKGHSNVRPSVKRWEMTGNPVKSRVVANFIEKK